MSRKTALAAGEQFYKGQPCAQGHTLRYTASYKCVACLRARQLGNTYCAAYQAYWRKANPEKARASRQRYAAKEPLAQLQARRDRWTAKRRALRDATLTALREEGYRI